MKSYALSLVLTLAALSAGISIGGCVSTGVKPQTVDAIAAAIRPISKNLVNGVLIRNPSYDSALLALASASDAAMTGGELTPETIKVFVDTFSRRYEIDDETKVLIASAIDDCAQFLRDVYGKKVVTSTDPNVRRVLSAFADGVRSGVEFNRAIRSSSNVLPRPPVTNSIDGNNGHVEQSGKLAAAFLGVGPDIPHVIFSQDMYPVVLTLEWRGSAIQYMPRVDTVPLVGGPFEIRELVVARVPVLVVDDREILGVRQKSQRDSSVDQDVEVAIGLLAPPGYVAVSCRHVLEFKDPSRLLPAHTIFHQAYARKAAYFSKVAHLIKLREAGDASPLVHAANHGQHASVV